MPPNGIQLTRTLRALKMLLELFIIALITRIDAFRSPCPDIFEYAISEEGLLCGAITLNSAEFESVVHLQVELLVTNQVMVKKQKKKSKQIILIFIMVLGWFWQNSNPVHRCRAFREHFGKTAY